ncbi:hypothetical protein GX441_05355 [bacterium]|nr:hypothetical protein [bacterium]
MLKEGPSSASIMVRGVSIISLTEYVRASLDPAEFGHFMLHRLTSDSKTLLQIQKKEWYPFSLQRKMREVIAEHFNPRDPEKAVYDAGIFAASYEIASFLKGMLVNVPFHLALNNISVMWKKYYNKGTLLINRTDAGVVIELKDFEPDPLFPPLIEAWFTQVFRTMGFLKVEVEDAGTKHSDDPVLQWRIRLGENSRNAC